MGVGSAWPRGGCGTHVDIENVLGPELYNGVYKYRRILEFLEYFFFCFFTGDHDFNGTVHSVPFYSILDIIFLLFSFVICIIRLFSSFWNISGKISSSISFSALLFVDSQNTLFQSTVGSGTLHDILFLARSI